MPICLVGASGRRGPDYRGRYRTPGWQVSWSAEASEAEVALSGASPHSQVIMIAVTAPCGETDQLGQKATVDYYKIMNIVYNDIWTTYRDLA